MDQMLMTEIIGLQDLPKDELQKRWRKLFGREPPDYGRRFMAERLAYRLQELRFGGLSAEARKQMDEILNEAGYDGLGEKQRGRVKRSPQTKPSLIAGTRLAKQWRGQQHEVVILEKGFEFEGRHYRSLSAIAKEITGSHWNGRAFFGVGPKRS